MKKIMTIGAVVFAVWGTETQAGFIDFESGYVDMQVVDTPIDTGDNLVSISLFGPAANPSGLPYIAGTGLPRTAFTTSFNPDLTSDEAPDARGGLFFLTDENVENTGVYASNYVFEFAEGINVLSLDLFDFRVDGGAQGNPTMPIDSATATLTLFADEAMTQIVGMTSFTTMLDDQPVDGGWTNILVTASDSAVKAVLNLGNLDRGVGVDNISFLTEPPPINPVPEPSSMLLLGIGAAGLFGYRCHQRKRLTRTMR